MSAVVGDGDQPNMTALLARLTAHGIAPEVLALARFYLLAKYDGACADPNYDPPVKWCDQEYRKLGDLFTRMKTVVGATLADAAPSLVSVDGWYAGAAPVPKLEACNEFAEAVANLTLMLMLEVCG